MHPFPAERLQILKNEGETLLCRRAAVDGEPSVLMLTLVADAPSPACLSRLQHELALRAELDPTWAVCPIALSQVHGQTALSLTDPGGELLSRACGSPWEVGTFLRAASRLAGAVANLHDRGLVHKDLRPSNLLWNHDSGDVWLMGFGVAARLPCDVTAPVSALTGTLAYMAPEQTGRTGARVDTRSDLYSLGVTLYELLTGVLPFHAREPVEWIHCHVAKQPVSPAERVQGTPALVSDLIMKLLAKSPEDRYQTARGVETDLQRCLLAFRAHGEISNFELGTHETLVNLRFPGRLYGRARESGLLRAAFERVETTGSMELLLVSGRSGVGKSALVHDFQSTLPGARALFAVGKADQYKRDIPYATFAQALRDVVRTMLGQNESELCLWRASLRQALGANGQLLVSLIPELALIIGKQAPLADLQPQELKIRFQSVFRRFLAALARPHQPLILFLDDLQWLDIATLDLLEHLATHREVRHLLLVGAYRDNEVGLDHLLGRALLRIPAAGTKLTQIAIEPLDSGAVCHFIADTLSMESGRVQSLAELVYEKTGGNPFFAVQFMTALCDGGLVTRSPPMDAARHRTWNWDLGKIDSLSFTENVVELMVGRLCGVPDSTRKMLSLLACIGNGAPVEILADAADTLEQTVHTDMAEAVRCGLVLRRESNYIFLHDRIQEASYALLAEHERAALHLKIGRLLLACTSEATREAAIFDVVNQLNRGVACVTSREEQTRIAGLNLQAGQLAKRATAFAAARSYLEAGAAVLAGSLAQGAGGLAFAIDFQRAECELLSSELTAANTRLARLAACADGFAERAAVACLRLDLFTLMDRSDLGVEVGLSYLAEVGVHWPRRPSDAQVRDEYDRLFTQLGARPVEAIAELAPMTDPAVRATMDVLTKLQVPALFYDENLQGMVIGRMATLSLEYGNSDGSAFAYCWLGGFLASHFGKHDEAFRFAKLSIRLVERPELSRFKARVHCVYGYLVMPWMDHLGRGIPYLRSANESAREIGDLTFVGYTENHLVTLSLALGHPLVEVQHTAELGRAFAEKARFGLVEAFYAGQLQLIRSLRGVTGSGFENEARFEQRLATDPALAIAACWYWIRKLQTRLFADDPAGALEAAEYAEPLLWTSTSSFEIAEYHFYAAVAHALVHDTKGSEDRTQHVTALQAHLQRVEQWAAQCPPNFAHRAALINAELARIQGRELAAEQSYEHAIELAREQGFTNNEALAFELAGRFHERRGLATAARAYLAEARRCYQLWGADAKVAQIDRRHPRLYREGLLEPGHPAPGASLEQLDLATVVKASQALSSEIVLDRLIETLLRMAVEHAGAERGLLVMRYGAKLQIEASARTENDGVAVLRRKLALSSAELPETVVQYVARTQQSVILGDASSEGHFASDPYFAAARRRSIACLPLVKQAHLVGVLYLENSLTAHAFPPALTAVLTLLASQAAISLENARLYGETDARLAFWTTRSQIATSFASSTSDGLDVRIDDALLMVGQLLDVDDISLCWLSRSGEVTEASWAWSKRGGAPAKATLAPSLLPESLAPLLHGEEVYIVDRDDLPAECAGERRLLADMHVRSIMAWPLVTNSATVAAMIFSSSRAALGSEETLQHARQLAEVFLNALARRRALLELGRSESALQQAQLELTHATRLTALGELAASIAHEVNQPLAAIVADAGAGLNWLSNRAPDLSAVRESLEAIARDGRRAGDVLSRIRALLRRTPIDSNLCDVSGIIQGVLSLVRSQLSRAEIALEIELGSDLPLVKGDAVELQQVVLNLVLNSADAARDVCAERRRITVRSDVERREGERWVVIAVEDRGIGIPASGAAKLFDTFYTTKSNGLGLGLSISRSIIERHGGRLWAHANPEHGATFSFALLGSS